MPNVRVTIFMNRREPRSALIWPHGTKDGFWNSPSSRITDTRRPVAQISNFRQLL